MRILVHWLVATVAVIVAAYLLPGVAVSSFTTALIAALVLGLVTAILRPILIFLTLPINFLTLGLFTLVINAGLVLLAARLVDGFQVDGFWWALLFSIVLALVSAIIEGLFPRTATA